AVCYHEWQLAPQDRGQGYPHGQGRSKLSEGHDPEDETVRRDRGRRSSLPRTHRRQMDRDYREESAEGTTLSLGGSFTRFAFAIAEAIFSSRAKRSSARVWAHRLTSCSMSF